MNYLTLTISSVISLSAISNLHAKGPQSERKTAFSVEEQLKSFELQDGFVIELVASEENGLINPIDLTFDDAGRLWTQTAKMYPLDPVPGINFGKAMQMMQDHSLVQKDERFQRIHRLYTLKDKGTDQILIIDKPHEQVTGPLKVWADGLTIPQSIMPYKDGCYVAHGSEMLFLDDKNKDGKQDSVDTVLSGFGFFDTHTMAHSIVRGPGGWMNFSHGAVNSGNVKVAKTGQETNITYSKNARFSLDGEKLEILNCHRDNNWGYQVKANGKWFSTSANDGGYSVLPFESMSSNPGNGDDKIRDYSPFFPPANKFRVGGTGISGLAFSEDGENGFPASFKDVAILANPMTRTLNCVSIIRNPDGTITSKRLPDLLKSKDDWFRPVNIEFGPDGCLYIADWYNQIISHNEVTTDHPDRDRKHGRIWRIRHKSQKPFTIHNVAAAKNTDLIKHLTNGKTLWEKRAAWHQIVDRNVTSLIPQLKTILESTETPKDVRVLSLWSLEGLRQYDKQLLKKIIDGADLDLRREAIRSFTTFKATTSDTVELIGAYLEDEHYMIRSQVLRTLEEIKSANHQSIGLLVQACKPAAINDELGGNYERNFERFLARKALESYTSELIAFLGTKDADTYPADNILWALQALPETDKVKLFVSNWEKNSQGEIDKNTLASISRMLHVPEVKDVITPTFKARSEELLKLSLENFDIVDTAKISIFYKNKIESLLNSEDEDKISEGVNLVNSLRSPHHTASLTKLMSPSAPSSLQDQIFSALSFDANVDSQTYAQILNNSEFSNSIRISALAATIIKAPDLANKAAQQLVSTLNDSEKKQLVSILSHTIQGNDLIKQLWKQKTLQSDHWDYNAAYRTKDSNISSIVHKKPYSSATIRAFAKKQSNATKDKRAISIFKAAQDTEKLAIKQRQEKIQSFVKASEKLTGNIQTGEAMFQSCLVCHKVGEKGLDLAPSLDGSKDRDLAHLITAIVNPDEAVEGTYGLHSVVRRDGSYIEGQLIKTNENGSLIGLPGGREIFIGADNIIYQGSVNSRSFMPNTFGNLDEQTMIDLVTYIKTL